MKWIVTLNLIMMFFIAETYGQSSSDSIQNKSFDDDFHQTINNMVDWFTIEKNEVIYSIYPLLDYNSRTGLSLGLMPVIQKFPEGISQDDRFFRPSTIAPSISISTQGFFDLDLEMALFTKNRWSVYMFANLIKLYDRFYEVGNNDAHADYTGLLSRNTRCYGEIAKEFNQLFFIGGRYDVIHIKNLEIDGDLLTDDVIGHQGGGAFTFGPVVKFDTRDNVIYPSRGSFFVAFAMFAPRITNSNYSYEYYAINLRQYFSLRSDKTILGLQWHTTLSSDDIPYFAMPRIAGKMALRGLEHPSKYIDKNEWYSQAELRQKIFGRFGGVVWFGAGNNFNSTASTMFDSVKYTTGLGVRFVISERSKMNFRLDLGFGFEGESALFITTREAF